MRARVSLLLALMTPVSPLCAQAPTVEELDKARPEVVRILAERMTQALGGRPADGSTMLLAAAFEAEERAVRYLLWRNAVEVAEKRGEAWRAVQHQRAMAAEFGLDPFRTGAELLQRMAADTEEPLRLASIATAALYSADDAPVDDERARLGLFDVSVRASLRAGHAPLAQHVRAQLELLRAPAAICAALPEGLPGSPWSEAQVVSALLHGEVRALEPFRLGQLRELFVDLEGLDTAAAAGSLSAEQLRALAPRARHPALRHGLRRCALERLTRSYGAADADQRRRIALELDELCVDLGRSDGVTRLRFEAEASRGNLVYANGDWRVVDGALRGKSTGANNFATSRVRFSAMTAVRIRGGIQSADGLNFRCKAGHVNLLLNWEVEDQNHLWSNGTCHRTKPRVLTPGQEHTIVIFSDGARSYVCVDGAHLYDVPGSLEGTVSVYPALGSEIFVREVHVVGLPDGLVDAPVGVLM
jgi:hypothetical protein